MCSFIFADRLIIYAIVSQLFMERGIRLNTTSEERILSAISHLGLFFHLPGLFIARLPDCDDAAWRHLRFWSDGTGVWRFNHGGRCRCRGNGCLFVVYGSIAGFVCCGGYLPGYAGQRFHLSPNR